MNKEILDLLIDIKTALKGLEQRVEALENPLINTTQTYMNIIRRINDLEDKNPNKIKEKSWEKNMTWQ